MGFAVEAIGRIAFGPEPLSSTAIRAAIREGDVAKARRLLGRPFRVSGEVIHGRKLGRTIGFPTANVMPPADLVPLADGDLRLVGVAPRRRFAAPGDHVCRQPANGQHRRPPRRDPPARLRRRPLWDKSCGSTCWSACGPTRSFPSLDALIAQMRVDEAQARAILAGEGAVAAVG
jgi:riboflavin kinase/FMN adenylyltransferase